MFASTACTADKQRMKEWYSGLCELARVTASELKSAGVQQHQKMKTIANYLTTFDTDCNIKKAYTSASEHASSVHEYIKQQDCDAILGYINEHGKPNAAYASMAGALKQLDGKGAALCWQKLLQLNTALMN